MKMSTRYGDRGPDRYEDAEEERYGGRDYERQAGRASDYERSRQRSDYGPTARPAGRDYDYSRDYGYERDSGTRDYGERDGRVGILSGYAGAPLSRRSDYEDYGRDYEREPSREYPRESAREHGRDYGREPARDYGRESARDQRHERVRGFDTDYGRTTSRFYGRSGYEYGRDDYDRPVWGGERGDYGRGEYLGRPGERGMARGRGERGWWDRAADEVLSWFGDTDAERRRRIDDLREGRGYGVGKFRGRGPKNYRRSDERIREEINDQMTENNWLDASDVDVSVQSGEVILSGTVDSRYAKRLAEDIADSVSGVANVQNNLRVRGYEAEAQPAGLAAPSTGATGATDTTLTSDILDTPDTPDVDMPGRASKAAGRG
jgi:osmotically-inducible protein OsmY